MDTTFNLKSLPVRYMDIKGPALFGKEVFTSALTSCGAVLCEVNHWTPEETGESAMLMIGTTSDRRIQLLLENADLVYCTDPESTICQWCQVQGGGSVLVLAGTDDVGLMYTLLEMAERIEADGFDALNDAEEFCESPDNRVRCVDRYVVGHLDDEWLKSEKFWRYYLPRLAKARFNRFCLIVGFDTAYMAPPYPFFVEVKGYESITVSGQDEATREDNLAALRRIGRLCHEHGIAFEFATWQQKPWTSEQKQLVSGLADDETTLAEYCYQGLRTLIRAVPEIDIVQFRVNHESGVGTQVSAEDFWNHCADAVAEIALEDGRPLILDLRAKGLTDAMIDYAFSRGLHVEVPTKYWCEHAAMPHHITIMRSEELAKLDNYNHSRRYSYADMLRKPRYYDVIYRLWNYGSTNLFLWGDADYARRFSLSCSLSGSAGLEINSPLALKYGHELLHKDTWHTFADPSLRTGEWEDERFWMWYTSYGRLGYSADTEPEVWMRTFRARFGEKSASVIERGLRAASKIIPFITTIHMPVHPSLRYWTEMSTGYAMFNENRIDGRKGYDFQTEITYGSTEPSDHGLFYGIDEYVSDAAQGKFQGKYSPLQSAAFLSLFVDEVKRCMAQMDAIGENNENAEYRAMLADMKLLCDMALYHVKKIHSAYALAKFQVTGEKSWLADAAALLDQAAAFWRSLSAYGQQVYHHDLEFSSAGTQTRHGTWQDLYREIEADRRTLENMLRENGIAGSGEPVHDYQPGRLPAEQFALDYDLPDYHMAGVPLVIEVDAGDLATSSDAQFVLHYRHTNQLEGVFNTIVMDRGENGWCAVVPGEYLTSEWDLMLYITTQDAAGSCLMLPGIYHPKYPYPYHVVSILN